MLLNLRWAHISINPPQVENAFNTLIYQISELPSLQRAWNTYISLQLGKIPSLLSITRVLYCPLLAWEKIKKKFFLKRSKFEVHFLLNGWCFPTIIKLKNHKPNHLMLGTLCTGFSHPLSMGCWYIFEGDMIQSCLQRHGILCESCEIEAHVGDAGTSLVLSYWVCAGFTQPATCSTSRSFWGPSHGLIDFLIIKPDCFMCEEFVCMGYTVYSKGTKMSSSISFPTSHSVVVKP